MKPLAIDLFCGLGGWTEGLLAEGYRVVGFDCERHHYGTGGYPAQLVLEDVQQLHGKQFRDAALIVASPPCQAYSYMAMPWSRGRTIAAEIRADVRRQPELNCLFNTCFRIQHEASVAAGRHVPMVVENVKGAQPWVGRARWHYSSFYLWGDVPALMPTIGSPGQTNVGQNPDGRKAPGTSWSGSDKPGYKPGGLNVEAARRYRAAQSSYDEVSGQKGFVTGLGNGHDWRQDPIGRFNSKSDSRKAASAQIAKIPLPLSRHIASVYYPH